MPKFIIYHMNDILHKSNLFYNIMHELDFWSIGIYTNKYPGCYLIRLGKPSNSPYGALFDYDYLKKIDANGESSQFFPFTCKAFDNISCNCRINITSNKKGYCSKTHTFAKLFDFFKNELPYGFKWEDEEYLGLSHPIEEFIVKYELNDI